MKLEKINKKKRAAATELLLLSNSMKVEMMLMHDHDCIGEINFYEKELIIMLGTGCDKYEIYVRFMGDLMNYLTAFQEKIKKDSWYLEKNINRRLLQLQADIISFQTEANNENQNNKASV